MKYIITIYIKIILTHMSNIIDKSFICPITLVIMEDPVIGSDGYTYEKSAIVDWLKQNSISPMNRLPMSINSLHPNRVLKDQIIEFKQKNSNTNYKIPANINTVLSDNNTNISVSYTDRVTIQTQTLHNLIKININETDIKEIGTDIICLLDISGSMGSLVKTKDETGCKLENGLTIMDIIKYAVKIVVNTLNNKSFTRFSLIAFDNDIEILFPLVNICDININNILDKINIIGPRGGTNIWKGIITALNMLNERENKNNNSTIMLFTDGCPNNSPAKGEIEELKIKYINEKLNTPIHTYGFGYNLQKGLLYGISKITNGVNYFIPDGTMVGTIFVNSISFILSTAVINTTLYETNNNGDRHKILDIGNIQFDQPRYIYLQHKQTSVNYEIEYYIGNNLISRNICNYNINICEDEININKLIKYTIETIKNCETLVNKPTKISDNLESLMDELTDNNTSISHNLLDTIKDQVLNAFNINYFNKWGKSYLDMLISSIENETKCNFKDKAVEHYIGNTFIKYSEEINKIFNNMEPPIPSRATIYTQPIHSMSIYNSSNNPCFSENCVILLHNNEQVKLKDLNPTDIIKTPNGLSKIKCIVKTITGGVARMCSFFGNGLEITPWHPVKSNNTWILPIDLVKPTTIITKHVYSLLLENTHIAYINNVQCICLGHTYTDDKILNHPYFASDKVEQDLQKCNGWENGVVYLKQENIIRTNGLVSKISNI
jgi:uncharacterized protein YegL